jgi:hypothetical protein
MDNNSTGFYFTRRDIPLISEMESKVVSVFAQWAVVGGVKWTRLWRHRSGDGPETLLTMICHISRFLSNHLSLKSLLKYSVSSAIF